MTSLRTFFDSFDYAVFWLLNGGGNDQSGINKDQRKDECKMELSDLDKLSGAPNGSRILPMAMAQWRRHMADLNLSESDSSDHSDDSDDG